MDSIHSNKNIALAFYTQVVGAGKHELLDEIMHEDYIQHNPSVKTGRAGVKEALKFLAHLPKPENPPNPFMRMIAQGDLVALHLQVEVMGQSKVVLDLFRFEHGRLAEHWDAIMDVPKPGDPYIEGPIVAEDLARTSANKKRVQQFWEKVQAKENWADFVAEDVLVHPGEAAQGPSAMQDRWDNRKLEKVHRIIVEGNFAVSQLQGVYAGEAHIFYDLFRLAEGKIVEYWTVYQAIPASMAHSNGMI